MLNVEYIILQVSHFGCNLHCCKEFSAAEAPAIRISVRFSKYCTDCGMLNTHKLFTDNSNISVSHLLAEYLSLLTKCRSIKRKFMNNVGREKKREGGRRRMKGKRRKKRKKFEKRRGWIEITRIFRWTVLCQIFCHWLADFLLYLYFHHFSNEFLE